MANLFEWPDYAVVAATLLFSVFIGIYYGFIAKQQTNDDLLLGGKSMGIAPIAASMLVTYLSAVTVLGYPAEVYGYGIQIFTNTISFLVVVPFSVYFFMTVFYKMQLTSVYEYLEHRFQSSFVRFFASFIFILQMSVFMGVCLYAPSIAMSAFMGLELWQSVVGLGLCATVYTSMGGLKAVVWTDVFQLMMILAGMFAIIIRGFIKSGGIMEAFEKAGQHGRLELFNFTVDPFMRHNTLNFFLGTGFAIFSGFATHQPQVQRYCSLPSLGHAIRATIFAMPLNVFTIGLCLLSGIVIFSSYAGCDPMATGTIGRVDGIVPHFVKTELSFIPGMMGLFTACVFSASLSTLSSGLNSLAAVTWEDFLSRIPAMKRMSPKGQANLIRFTALAYGVLSIALAFGAQRMGSILAATITALGALSGPLGMVFVMGVLMPFVNKYGAITGMVTGFLSMLWITINAFILDKSHIPMPFSADDCPTQAINSNLTMAHVEELQFPEKLYTLSYILYPFVGGIITGAVGIVVSLFSGGICQAKNINPKYLHPIVRPRGNSLKSKEMEYVTNGHYTRVIPAAAPQYAKISPVSPTSSQYYSYESPTHSLVLANGEKSPIDDQSVRPLLYRMPSSTSNRN
ncbi:Sodium-coupled monocarboxylate transporter 1 [Orchesella cincta]|uniref:Sodium-coupled monocarboxylate transporter 1 n=1 Tax=Orchesella cincta TaxID=48709 RepID=A0A1D2NH10_ORCCI|nr:Sodium-coupled monocarboxylate transporter 1 [Orchesella cincta]